MGNSIFNTGYHLQDQIDAAESAMAIVSTGDTHAAITSGQYVYVREHGTLAEGLYRATANIAANGTLSGSNVTAVSGGGLNALNSNLAKTDVTLTAGSNCTINVQNSYKCNGILYVNAMVNVNTQMSQNDDLFTLPTGTKFKRRTDYQTYNGTPLVGLQNSANFFVVTGTLATGLYSINFCADIST